MEYNSVCFCLYTPRYNCIYRQREREKRKRYFIAYIIFQRQNVYIYMYTLLVLDKKNDNLQMSTTDEYATIFQKSKLTQVGWR